MADQATQAIIFDCFGVLYGNNGAFFHKNKLNTELITYIRKNLAPRYKVGLLSNIDRKWIDKFVAEHHLEDLFDAVVVSGDEGVTKPNALIYQQITLKLETTPAACVMIDDLRENCDGAERVGMKSILYIDNQQMKNELFEFTNK